MFYGIVTLARPVICQFCARTLRAALQSDAGTVCVCGARINAEVS